MGDGRYAKYFTISAHTPVSPRKSVQGRGSTVAVDLLETPGLPDDKERKNSVVSAKDTSFAEWCYEGYWRMVRDLSSPVLNAGAVGFDSMNPSLCLR